MIYLGEHRGRQWYEFLPHELSFCASVADELCESKAESAKTTAYGKDIRDVDLIGILGEYMAYWHYDQDFRMWIDEFSGDDGADIIVKGVRYQIKTTIYDNDPRLCAKLNDPLADIYVLCHVKPKSGIGSLMGYATQSELIKESNKGRLRENLPMNYMLRENQLHRFGKG